MAGLSNGRQTEDVPIEVCGFVQVRDFKRKVAEAANDQCRVSFIDWGTVSRKATQASGNDSSAVGASVSSIKLGHRGLGAHSTANLMCVTKWLR
jgi:hypothetical protein